MTIFDETQLKRHQQAFALARIDEHAVLKEMRSRLLESLEYYQEKQEKHKTSPVKVLDVSWDHGETAQALQKVWPKADVVAVKPVFNAERGQTHGWNPFKKKVQYMQGDVRNINLPDANVDVLVSFLALQWSENLDEVFAEFRRVLKPDGFLLCMTFGHQTLIELREAFIEADSSAAHLHPFPSIADLGDSLMRAGFHNPVLDRDDVMQHYPSVRELMRLIKTYRNSNALQLRRRSLTGRKRFSEMQKNYQHQTRHAPTLIASWEFISAHAWSPKPGVAIHYGGRDVVTFPGHSIPVRKRE